MFQSSSVNNNAWLRCKRSRRHANKTATEEPYSEIRCAKFNMHSDPMEQKTMLRKKKLIYTSTNPTRTNVTGSRMLMYLELQFRNCSHGRWWTTHRPKNFDRWMLAKFQISTIRSISKLRISTCFFGQISIEVWDGASAAGAQGAAGICHVEVTLSKMETTLLQQRNTKSRTKADSLSCKSNRSELYHNYTSKPYDESSAPALGALPSCGFNAQISTETIYY